MVTSSLKFKKSRRGVTVLEVLFATGIAIFGLLGIYSLLPLAARQANEANEATEGQAYGHLIRRLP
jgi:Tfp pilus assembly protein PilV